MNGKVIWTSVKRIADVMNFLSEKYYQERSGIPHYQVELPPDNPDGRVAGMLQLSTLRMRDLEEKMMG